MPQGCRVTMERQFMLLTTKLSGIFATSLFNHFFLNKRLNYSWRHLQPLNLGILEFSALTTDYGSVTVRYYFLDKIKCCSE